MSEDHRPARDVQQALGQLTVSGAIWAGSAGGLLFGINFALQALVFLFEIPGASGFLSGLTVPLVLAIICQITRERGTATIAWTLYSLLAIPTQLMGIPGPYKAVLGLLGGLAYDAGYSLLRGRRAGLFLGLLLYLIVLNAGFYSVAKLGLFPEVAAENVLRILALVTAVFLVEGIVSTWAAIVVYERRIKRLLP